MKNFILLAMSFYIQKAGAQQTQFYTNDVHRYTLSYQGDWYMGPTVTPSRMSFLYKKFPTNSSPDAEIRVEIDTIKSTFTDQEYFNNCYRLGLDEIKTKYRKSEIQQQDSLLIEGNHPALLFQWTDKFLGTDHYALFRTVRQKKIYSVYFHQNGSGSKGKIVADAVKTISSFKLLPLPEELKTVKEPIRFADLNTQASGQNSDNNAHNSQQNPEESENTIKNKKSPTRSAGKISGGGFATYDLLGRQLLLALKTNNVSLWKQCIHPTYGTNKDPDAFSKTVAQLHQIRDILLPDGLSDWRKVTFSRILAKPCNSCAKAGEQWLTEMQIDAWYQGKEFLVRINFSPAFTDKGKWFIGGFYGAEMIRAVP